MVFIRYTRKRYIHSNFIADIWGLDGTKQGTSKIYAKYFLQSRLNMGFLVSAVAHHCCSGVTLGKLLKTQNIK